jgi:hypothetical protein
VKYDEVIVFGNIASIKPASYLAPKRSSSPSTLTVVGLEKVTKSLDSMPVSITPLSMTASIRHGSEVV